MRIIKNIYHWVARIKYKKYIVVLVLGVLLVGFIGESTVVAHLRNKAIKAEWQKEKDYWEAEYQKNEKEIDQLYSSPRAIEKKARELYYMKADDEDIFILSGDEAE